MMLLIIFSLLQDMRYWQLLVFPRLASFRCTCSHLQQTSGTHNTSMATAPASQPPGPCCRLAFDSQTVQVFLGAPGIRRLALGVWGVCIVYHLQGLYLMTLLKSMWRFFFFFFLTNRCQPLKLVSLPWVMSSDGWSCVDAQGGLDVLPSSACSLSHYLTAEGDNRSSAGKVTWISVTVATMVSCCESTQETNNSSAGAATCCLLKNRNPFLLSTHFHSLINSFTQHQHIIIPFPASCTTAVVLEIIFCLFVHKHSVHSDWVQPGGGRRFMTANTSSWWPANGSIQRRE